MLASALMGDVSSFFRWVEEGGMLKGLLWNIRILWRKGKKERLSHYRCSRQIVLVLGWKYGIARLDNTTFSCHVPHASEFLPQTWPSIILGVGGCDERARQ